VNTFATLLLAFPFYLAVNSRLIAYTSLVVKQPQAVPVGGSSNAVTTVPTVPVG
jgi:hypothetical protein